MIESFSNNKQIQDYKQAQSLLLTGKSKQALKILRHIHKANPEWGPALFTLCDLTLNHTIEISETEKLAWFKQLDLKIFSLSPIALTLKSRICEANNDLIEAERLLQKCLKYYPDSNIALQQLAALKLRQEAWKEAESILRHQLETSPGHAHILTNLSIALLRQNMLGEALKYANQAFKHGLPEQQASLHVNIGTILQELGNREKARLHYKKALSIDPRNINANLNLGVIALQEKNFKVAESQFRITLKYNSNDVRANVNLAGLLLMTGHAQEGWDYYDKRLYPKTKIINAPTDLPRWNGEPINGALMLVHEQGLGDSFQFIRYAANLNKLNIKCYFRGPKKLHNLFIYSSLVAGCLEDNDPIPADTENWIALMSLPRIFNDSLNNTSSMQFPYLKCDPDRLLYWQNTLGVKPCLRLALHWQGNPAHEFTISRGRSIHLSKLNTLLNMQGIEWINLQKGPGCEQADSHYYSNYWHAEQHKINEAWGFQDAAAILQCCDGLISSDSGLAHLAGALNVKVFLMLPWLAEWRWGEGDENTKWYPNHHLYRQQKEGDWDSVVKNIQTELTNLIDCKESSSNHIY